MKSQALLCFFCFLLTSNSWAGDTELLPKGFCPLLVEYSSYTLCYDADHRQAAWVKHKLTLEQVNGPQKRTNNYRMDPQIEDPVVKTDYKGSGFDRGHLLPAADRKKDYQSMSETFFMTNMSPQRPGFNRRVWAAIEKEVRRLVRDSGEEAHVITAPILNSGLEQLSTDVSIPDWYYKIVYFPKSERMLAYLIENKQYPYTPLNEFHVTVDEVESLSGFDFFADLPDVLENSLESQLFENTAEQ